MKTLLKLSILLLMTSVAQAQLVLECSNNSCVAPVACQEGNECAYSNDNGNKLDFVPNSDLTVTIPAGGRASKIYTANPSIPNPVFSRVILNVENKAVPKRVEINLSGKNPADNASSLILTGDFFSEINVLLNGYVGKDGKKTSEICAQKMRSGDDLWGGPTAQSIIGNLQACDNSHIEWLYNNVFFCDAQYRGLPQGDSIIDGEGKWENLLTNPVVSYSKIRPVLLCQKDETWTRCLPSGTTSAGQQICPAGQVREFFTSHSFQVTSAESSSCTVFGAAYFAVGITQEPSLAPVDTNVNCDLLGNCPTNINVNEVTKVNETFILESGENATANGHGIVMIYDVNKTVDVDNVGFSSLIGVPGGRSVTDIIPDPRVRYCSNVRDYETDGANSGYAKVPQITFRRYQWKLWSTTVPGLTGGPATVTDNGVKMYKKVDPAVRYFFKNVAN